MDLKTIRYKSFNYALQAGRKTGRNLLASASRTGEWMMEKRIGYTAETGVTNWYIRAAKACEQNADAIQGAQDGVSSKISRGVAAKLGMASTSAGIFSIASLIGTASTGTAIGSLSGAAFTSASLAWLGGSVVVGTAILGIASVAGGIGAALGLAWLSKKYVYGEQRKPHELSPDERSAVDACMALAIAFREHAKAGTSVDPLSARYLHDEALKPLSDSLTKIEHLDTDRPAQAQKRSARAAVKLRELTDSLLGMATANPNVSTGVVTVVVLRLLSDDLGDFTENELLVLDAMRRSSGDLSNASQEDLAEYVQGLEPSQLRGLQNNVKGIYHELRFVESENNDGDQYVAELFESTNHPGADVRITNLETGEVREVQLKATQYMHSVREHNERYESIDVLATSEVAAQDPSIDSSGFLNNDLSDDVEGVSEQMAHMYDPGVVDSMAVAGTIALARNVRVLLKGGSLSAEERERLVKDGALSAGIAGLFSLALS